MKQFLAITFVILAISVKAQDPNFSQFFASPLTLNPAMTGKFNGVSRVAVNYRNQWPAINNAFRTGTASVDLGILPNRIPEFDQFGVGVMGMYDQNASGIMKNSYIAASVAYHKGLDESGYHSIGAGFSSTYASKRLDISKLNFEDELTSLGFTGVTSEFFNNYGGTGFLNFSYTDVNAGVLYSGATNDYNNFYLGASLYHINRPKVSFQGANFLLNPRFTVHGGGYFPVADATTLFVSSSYQLQAKADEFILGGAIGLTINDNYDDATEMYFGSWVRWNDAIIPYIGLERGNFRFGVTYDINTSGLTAASERRGGFEASLIYIVKHKDPNKKGIPCPRF
jgi:type IX secretion system PorP/SprF family membrane protein